MGACCRIDAEWIMDKRDWKEAKRRAAAIEKTGGVSESGSGSPPLSGAHASASAVDAEAGTYRPEMDEMRCLLWAHGGQDNLCSGFPGLLYLFA
jgi:hypothetical protein